MRLAILVLLFVSLGFAGEIVQGKLENGMRYYILCSDTQTKKASLRLIVKRPKELAMAGSINPFIEFDGIESTDICGFLLCDEFPDWAEYSEENIDLSLLPCFLACLTDRLKSDNLFLELVDEFREEYEEEQQEIPPKLLEIANFFCDADPLYVKRLLKTADDTQIGQVLQALFEPSRMAIVISGSTLDPISVENELKRTLGTFKGNGMFLSPIAFKPQSPLAAFSIDENQPYVFYCYTFEPTFRNQAMNDLFINLFYHSVEVPLLVPEPGRLEPKIWLPATSLISELPIDEMLFRREKEQLKRSYQKDNITDWVTCCHHFLSGIEEPLELANQNLLRELGDITLEELDSFIRARLEKIPVIDFRTRE